MPRLRFKLLRKVPIDLWQVRSTACRMPIRGKEGGALSGYSREFLPPRPTGTPTVCFQAACPRCRLCCDIPCMYGSKIERLPTSRVSHWYSDVRSRSHKWGARVSLTDGHSTTSRRNESKPRRAVLFTSLSELIACWMLAVFSFCWQNESERTELVVKSDNVCTPHTCAVGRALTDALRSVAAGRRMS